MENHKLVTKDTLNRLLLKDKQGGIMAKIAIVTGATGGLGQEFIKEIQKIDEIDEIWRKDTLYW